MSELDILVTKKLVAYREEILKSFKEKHPYVVGMLETVFSGKENRVGLQVTDSGRVVGEYTFIVTGIQVSGTETGRLNPSLKHPLLGITIKPYIQIEKATLEKMITDESYKDDILAYTTRILPDITIKFIA
ncbi:hypothetical protein [Anaerospora hongkongensis]|uniref:hypothetical protein n=1 Tax=Anaerospora hongkongensis TaxID=244830 RepID=UPI002FDB730C